MEEFIGTIKMFAGNFAPEDWELCQGQQLQISQFTALYAVIGTNFGGDGKTTFMLPNLCGRVPVGENYYGKPYRSPRKMGQTGGEVNHLLTVNEMASHSHDFNVSKVPATIHEAAPGVSIAPQTMLVGRASVPVAAFSDYVSTPIPFRLDSMYTEGQGHAHNNVQPSLGINYIICVKGLFPPHNFDALDIDKGE
ncbi:MAG: phage tail protein [Bacteroidetes bacterium]|nr:MAG: phage tail protein [Bacteroidota bacterium]